MALSLQQKLDDAKAAYHKLMTGVSARVYVDQNSERVEFTAINASKLAAYIQQLTVELANEGRPASCNPYKPLGFTF